MALLINKLLIFYYLNNAMNNKIKIIFFSALLKLILNSIFITCRWKVVGLESFNNAIKKNKPILLCSWHEHLLCVARYFKNNSLNLYGISSTHLDSEILAKILSSWKIKLIRGSSTRGWVSVLKKMLTVFKDPSSIIVLTNDGPKGPPKIAKEGSLSVAKKQGAQIVAISSYTNRSWRLNSWDKTLIPKPFSTIYINFSINYPDNKEINSDLITKFISDNAKDRNH